MSVESCDKFGSPMQFRGVQTLHRHAAATWPGPAAEAALCLAAGCTQAAAL